MGHHNSEHNALFSVVGGCGDQLEGRTEKERKF
jgi:hypothetical protein